MSLTKIELSQLLQTYSNLLTDKQRAALSMYCDCDCSLGEISEEIGISRQGVRDAILKAENALCRYEESLRLSEFVRALSVALQADDDVALRQIVEKYISKE